jgi:hypothetical protein
VGSAREAGNVSWFAAFALTIVIELPVVAACCAAIDGGQQVTRRAGVVGTPLRVAGVAFAFNLVSHVLLWFVVFPGLSRTMGWIPALLIAETAVVVGEGRALVSAARVPFPDAVAVSACANGASVLAGLVLTAR